MRRADFCVVATACVEVVVDLINASVREPLGLFRCEQAQAGADIQVVLLLDLGHNFADRVHLTLCGTTSGNHNAEGF